MKVIIYAPGMPFDKDTIPSGKSLGGSETAAYYLAQNLVKMPGVAVDLFTSFEGAQIDGKIKYIGVGEMSEKLPLGATFMRYAAECPHDVLIMQRHPAAFHFKYASKINYWWTHDLATKRFVQMAADGFHNINKIFAVSEWHAKQMGKVYGIHAQSLTVLPNAVDLSLYTPLEKNERTKTLLYTSRPERGLANLVAPDGIMEQLQKSHPEFTLIVAGYDNTTPNMTQMYQELWRRCDELPNVQNVGPLGKKQLADLMCSAYALVYPTTFEETSCITVMEAQAAGLPIIATKVGALPDTLASGGALFSGLNKDGQVDLKKFVTNLSKLIKGGSWLALHQTAIKAARARTWDTTADILMDQIHHDFVAMNDDHSKQIKHYIHNSDIVAAKNLVKSDPTITANIKTPFSPYDFMSAGEKGLAQHYDDLAKWEAERGINHGLGGEHLYSMPRFQVVLQQLSRLKPGDRVLDYGCGPGHFTIAAAKKFPHLEFVGVDVSAIRIQDGLDFLKDNPQPNVKLYTAESYKLDLTHQAPVFAAAIIAEVLEHVPEPGEFADMVEEYLKEDGLMIVTTPFGPWEADTYKTHPYRMHLHHLEEEDLRDMFGAKEDFQVAVVGNPQNQFGEALGAYLSTWKRGNLPAGQIDYERKHQTQAPRETLSVCIISKGDELALAKTLESVELVADEVVLGVDCGAEELSDTSAYRALMEFSGRTGVEVVGFKIESPLVTGFDEARNVTIGRAVCDWIFWIDADETLVQPQRLGHYLRANLIDAFAVAQHHYSAEPAQVLKTDFPTRFFRNFQGTQFFGRVHEHPEQGMNQGFKQVSLMKGISICHNGYTTEAIRRKRFERNFPLLVRDRKDYPGRILAKFLWLRDLAHMNGYEAEQNGGQVSPGMMARSHEMVAIWRDLVSNQKTLRYAIDAMPYYSEASRMVNPAHIQGHVGISASCLGIGDDVKSPPRFVSGVFSSYADLELLTNAIVGQKGELFDGAYMQ